MPSHEWLGCSPGFLLCRRGIDDAKTPRASPPPLFSQNCTTVTLPNEVLHTALICRGTVNPGDEFMDVYKQMIEEVDMSLSFYDKEELANFRK